MSDETADLTLLTRQQRQILTELGEHAGRHCGLIAIVLRQDGTLTVVLGEFRAMCAPE